MSRHLLAVLAAVGITAAIGLISGGEWPHFVMGAVFALALWVILSFGTSAKIGAITREVSWQTYAIAGAAAVALGFVFYTMGDDNGAWWAPAVILVGILMPMVPQPSGASAPGE